MTEWELAAQATKAAVLKLIEQKASREHAPPDAELWQLHRLVRGMPLPVQTGQM